MRTGKLEAFDPSSVRTLKSNVVELIYDAILSGEFKPGERLNESVLARRLRISRTPIREALNQLQDQGVVGTEPRHGVHVVSLSKQDVREIVSIRLILETEALTLCKGNFDLNLETELGQLLETLDGMNPELVGDDFRVDLQFHRTIWAHSGNMHLEKTLARLTAPLFVFCAWDAELRTKKYYSHRLFLEFLQGKSDQSAREVVQQHMQPILNVVYAGNGTHGEGYRAGPDYLLPTIS